MPRKRHHYYNILQGTQSNIIFIAITLHSNTHLFTLYTISNWTIILNCMLVSTQVYNVCNMYFEYTFFKCVGWFNRYIVFKCKMSFSIIEVIKKNRFFTIVLCNQTKFFGNKFSQALTVNEARYHDIIT